MKPSYIIAFVVLVVTGGITMFSFKDSIAQHVTIAQVMTRPGTQVQVPGAILKDTVTFSGGALRFDIVPVELLPKDDSAKLDSTTIPPSTPRLTVVYSQPKPENFDNAKQVEAVGTYKDGAFQAQSLLVKCPSKYSDKKTAAAGSTDSGSGGTGILVGAGVVLAILGFAGLVIRGGRTVPTAAQPQG